MGAKLVGGLRLDGRVRCVAGLPTELAVFLPVEPVHDAVHYRCDHEGRRDQEYQTRVERIETCEQLTSIRSRRVYRTHSAHEHCSIQEGIAPWELLEVLVARHAKYE
jgi:hypothetical protein